MAKRFIYTINVSDMPMSKVERLVQDIMDKFNPKNGPSFLRDNEKLLVLPVRDGNTNLVILED